MSAVIKPHPAPKHTLMERYKCRMCLGTMQPVYSLTPTPIANEYAERPDSGAHRYPLELSQCSVCKHVQQRYTVSDLFEDYKYTTPAIVAKHLAPSAQLLRERHPKAKKVLEIGSNNGVFLKVLREHGFDALGIDPAATGEGNIRAYFNLKWADQYFQNHGKFDLVVANNVFAHIDNLADVLHGVERLLTDDGTLVFEVQYFPALVAAGAFDMIYHEHMDYHTLMPLSKFLKRMGLRMTAHDFLPTHGGSIRVTASRAVKEIQYWEAPVDLGTFAARVEKNRQRVRELTEGRKLVLLGAAAKVTTMIHHCDIADRILFACDDTPQKQGRYIPGTDILIKPTAELGKHAALLGAWNFASELQEKFPDNELVNPFA